MNRLPALFLLAFFATPLPAVAASIGLGDLAITYDPTRWEATAIPGDGDRTTVRFVCLTESCRKACRGYACREGPVIVAMATPADRPASASCEPPNGYDIEPGWGWDGEADRETYGGLLLCRWTSFSGCRAYTPAEREAAGTAGRFAYSFSTGFNMGCTGIEGVPAPMFEELLRGITLVAPGASSSP